ncbi:MAG TPA: sulfotransferase family 2 domain-containing protein [Opitutus sp.]|nr:sulfotransferase family 2 domain-containing protein [Opitutus sp.]
MIISYRRRFLFIHIEKAAGTSVKKALGPYAHRPLFHHRVFRKLGLHGLYPHYKMRMWTEHLGAAAVKHELPAWEWDRLFRFTFVRNPWDLELSRYFFYRAMKNWSPEDPRAIATNRAGSFRAYLDWRQEQRIKRQVDYIFDEGGAPLLHFVGRVETIDGDFETVTKKIGIDARLPHVNQFNTTAYRKSTDYRDHYDDESAAIVERLVRKDIAVLGYAFDNRGLAPVRLGRIAAEAAPAQAGAIPRVATA